MKFLFIVILTLGVARTFALEETEEVLEKCEACDESKCPPVSTCSNGFVKDRCGCCDVCALYEFQLCNVEKDWNDLVLGKAKGPWHGRCGSNLICRVRTDTDPAEAEESICYCRKTGIVCGSDGNTYSHCKMESVIAESNGKINILSTGPCKSEPKIISHSDIVEVKEGDKVTLLCEIRGYPIPTVTWYFTSKDKAHEKIRLPNDSDEISVSLRGGPMITHQTSHLQINSVTSEHEGGYQCIAENDIGVEVGNAILTVRANNNQENDSFFGSEL